MEDQDKCETCSNAPCACNATVAEPATPEAEAPVADTAPDSGDVPAPEAPAAEAPAAE